MTQPRKWNSCTHLSSHYYHMVRKDGRIYSRGYCGFGSTKVSNVIDYRPWRHHGGNWCRNCWQPPQGNDEAVFKWQSMAKLWLSWNADSSFVSLPLFYFSSFLFSFCFSPFFSVILFFVFPSIFLSCIFLFSFFGLLFFYFSRLVFSIFSFLALNGKT